MSNISNAFKADKIFIPFVTGGDPDIETTEKLLFALRDAGAGIIEIGIPFSDPIAEGPVIEAASVRALKAGCTTEKLFDLVSRIRNDITVPILFMTYYNPVFVYGVDRFTEKCASCGVDGLIVPDLPFEERSELLSSCRDNGVELISLIAPTSCDERLDDIAKNSGGFLYCVSTLGVTGERSNLGDFARDMIAKVKKASDIPCAVGFGISNPQQARDMTQFADGVITGSAIVRIVAEHGRDCVPYVYDFAKSMVNAIKVSNSL